jgi:hypothetical protein
MSITQSIRKKLTVKTLSILLLLFPFLIVLFTILLFIFISDLPNIVGDILLYLFLYVSPFSVGIGIYLSIKNKDTHKGILSNKVSKRRKVIGKVILLGVITPIFLFLVGTILYINFVDNIENKIRKEYNDKYVKELAQRYECQSNTEEEEYELDPTLIGTYEYIPDEYTWDFNIYDYGYYTLDAFLNVPNYYIPKEKYSLEKVWQLKNNYDLELECDSIDFSKISTSESYKCSISYNGEFISDNVRHDGFCFWESSKSCTDKIGVILYSNQYSAGSVEYLFLISKDGEIHNKLSAYKLEEGDVTLLPFKYEYKGEYFSDTSYIVSGTDFDFLGMERYGMFDRMMDGDEALLTFFYEPTMGVYNNIEGIYSLWDLEEDGFYLKTTSIELIPDWVSETEDPT